MPSTSKKQHNFMAAIAHNPSFAKKVGVSQSVGKDFVAANKGKTFARGGSFRAQINKQDTRHGKTDMPFTNLNRFAGLKKGGAIMKEPKGMMKKEVSFMQKKGAPKSMIKHEKAEMGMAKGGMPMKDGKPAFMKKFAKGGGIEVRGKTKGTIIRMASGGSVSSASRRADGIAQRGKTRC
jgi:hypothetical protein